MAHNIIIPYTNTNNVSELLNTTSTEIFINNYQPDTEFDDTLYFSDFISLFLFMKAIGPHNYIFFRILFNVISKIAYQFSYFLFVSMLTAYIINYDTPYTIYGRIIRTYFNTPHTETGSDSDSDTDSDSDSESDLVSNSEDEFVSKPGNLGSAPKIGDIIRFNVREMTEDKEEALSKYSKYGIVARCVSTYGQTPIEPFPGYKDENGDNIEGELYVVTKVDSTIPNCKSGFVRKLRGDVDADKTENTHIHVVPLGHPINDMFPPIFWYINFEALAICQHESGTVTQFIDDLVIIGHYDRYNRYYRESAPSPESVYDYSSDYDSEK